MRGADEWGKDAGVYRSREGMNSPEGACLSGLGKGGRDKITEADGLVFMSFQDEEIRRGRNDGLKIQSLLF